MILVSVIIPVFNEENSIIQLLRTVNQQQLTGIAFEIIVIDDCSRDQTRSLLLKNPDLYTHLVSMPKKRRKGSGG